MRSQPLWVASYLAGSYALGRDESSLWDGYPDREIHFYGAGLAAEAKNDSEAAARAYREGLKVPQSGDVRMLLSHHLARVLAASGDAKGAAAACDEVLHPRDYRPYRALLLPDCLVWIAAEEKDPAKARALYLRLVDHWRGEFDHPAVRIARERLKEMGPGAR